MSPGPHWKLQTSRETGIFRLQVYIVARACRLKKPDPRLLAAAQASLTGLEALEWMRALGCSGLERFLVLGLQNFLFELLFNWVTYRVFP